MSKGVSVTLQGSICTTITWRASKTSRAEPALIAVSQHAYKCTPLPHERLKTCLWQRTTTLLHKSKSATAQLLCMPLPAPAQLQGVQVQVSGHRVMLRHLTVYFCNTQSTVSVLDHNAIDCMSTSSTRKR